jgi:hypothetical protein
MYSENELTGTLPSAFQTIRKIKVPFQDFDLEGPISSLKNDKKWDKGEMNSMILLKNCSKSVVLAVVHQNTEISYSSVKNPTIQVIEGQLKIHSPKSEDRILNSGEKISLNDSKFIIDSVKETAFLLILNT